jgi:hypothetical protein
LVEDQIKRVGERGEIHGEAAEQMLIACEAARQYGQAYIDIQHGLLRTRKEHQWTYAYSPIARQLLEQLEIAAFDEGSQYLAMAKAIVSELRGSQPVQEPIDIKTVVEQVIRGMEAAKVPQANAAPIQHICDACESSFDTPQGLSLHKTRHCKGKPE